MDGQAKKRCIFPQVCQLQRATGSIGSRVQKAEWRTKNKKKAGTGGVSGWLLCAFTLLEFSILYEAEFQWFIRKSLPKNRTSTEKPASTLWRPVSRIMQPAIPLRAMAERGIWGCDTDNSNGTVTVVLTAAANSHRVRCTEFKAIWMQPDDARRGFPASFMIDAFVISVHIYPLSNARMCAKLLPDCFGHCWIPAHQVLFQETTNRHQNAV